MTDTPPEIPVETARQSLLDRASVVWIVPILALVIALGIAWQSYSDRGPLIEIAFETATGMSAGETELRYRDVGVGVVEEIAFSDSLEQVIARVRLDKEIAPYVDGDAQFWIVRPEVTTRGVSGLGTVLSGVYIEGSWDTEASGLVDRHAGLSEAPLTTGSQRGLRILLSAGPGSSITEGTPILYKGIEVGRIGTPELKADGSGAEADAVIFEPYDQLVTSATRFWDTSGFSFSIGANGAELDFSSLASLIAGGVTFETLVSGGVPVEAGAEFDVFSDESSARASLFTDNRAPAVDLMIIFRENVSGLAVGASVELDGVSVGEVSSIRGIVDPDRFGDDAVRLLTTLSVRPSRLGLDTDGIEDALDYFDERVRGGLRARLATASILTGGLKIELLDVPGVGPAELDRDADPFPAIPSTVSNISDVSATAEGVFQRINDLPIEELIQAAIDFLDTATSVAGSEDVRGVPGDVRSLIGDVRGVVGSDEVQALPGQVAGLLAQIEAATADLAAIAGDLRQADVAAELSRAVDAAAQAAASVETGTEGLPELISELTEVARRAGEVPLDQLSADLSAALAAAEAFLVADDTQALPASLSAALGEVEAALRELREGGAVTNLNRTLASAESAASAVEAAVADLPELTRRMEDLLAQAASALSGIDENSELNREARAALRDVQAASEAVERLARTLERRPNSVILGR